MKIGVVAAVALFRTIAPGLQKVTDYSIRSIGGSADLCGTRGMNRFPLSHDSVTCRRSPEVSSTAFDAQPPDLPPVRLMDMGFVVVGLFARHRRPRIRFLFIGSHLCSALLSGPASASVISPLRFAITSRPSRCEEDLHLQAVEHARHTKKREHSCAPFFTNLADFLQLAPTGK